MMRSWFLPIITIFIGATVLPGCEAINSLIGPLKNGGQPESEYPEVVAANDFSVSQYPSVSLYIEDYTGRLDRGVGVTTPEVRTIFTQALMEKGYKVSFIQAESVSRAYYDASFLSKIATKNDLDGIFVVSVDGVDTRQYEPEDRKAGDATVHYQSEVKVSAKLIDGRTTNIVWSASYKNILLDVEPSRDGTAIPPSVTVLSRGITPMRASPLSSIDSSQTVSAGTSTKPRYDNAGYDLETVKTAQNELIVGGYTPGVADGLAGKKTADALRKFQGAQGLKVTAALNDETIALLHTLYGDSTPKSIAATPGETVDLEKAVEEPLSDVAVSTTATASGSAKITRGPADVYNKPSPFGRVLKTLGNGVRIEVIGTTGEWVEIKLGKTVGYLYKDLTNLVD